MYFAASGPIHQRPLFSSPSSAAKQAPEAKGEGEKKEEPKEPSKEAKDGVEKK